MLAMGVCGALWAQDYPAKVHDPSTVVREGGSVWFFSTGMGVKLMQRTADGSWKHAGQLFERGKEPEWHREMVPENRGHLWAPDIIRSGDRWWVYYSVSSFGKNTSAIGLASSATLDPSAENYGWKDEGMVIRSERRDRFNAIDPAVIRDGKRLWMSFGSFWDGIMLVELDPETGLMNDPEAKPVRLAHHHEIEAPFICERDGWYYLFVNWGLCCRGVRSTYEIRVGRSRKIEGPYVDREGVRMTDGGGSLVMSRERENIGPGHASIFENGGKQWLVHHFYDGEDRGKSKLGMAPLSWKDGWPKVK
ncbi:intracellular endo-alpha-(1-_5)-L-arabinanase [Haloferula helveola]